MDIKGQRIVIVGGSSGIGLATARAANELGADVVVLSSRRERIAQTRQMLPGVSGYVVDVTDEAATNSAFEQIGVLDHLVYTAAQPIETRMLNTVTSEWAAGLFGIRYFGAINATRAALRSMSEVGSITLTSGEAGARPGSGWAVAASVAAAVEGLTRGLAVELAPRRVNVVAPAVTRTPMWDDLAPGARHALYKGMQAKTLCGRAAEPQEIAAAYIYAMTQTYQTGSVIEVSGGALLA